MPAEEISCPRDADSRRRINNRDGKPPRLTFMIARCRLVLSRGHADCQWRSSTALGRLFFRTKQPVGDLIGEPSRQRREHKRENPSNDVVHHDVTLPYPDAHLIGTESLAKV